MSKYISQEGLEKLKKELQERKIKIRREIAKRIQEAKALGDLSENSEYIEAKEMQAFNEGRIKELEERIREAKIVRKRGRSPKVIIGSVVKVKKDDKTQEFVIVGSEESNPLEGKISNESPLGSAFLGHKKGETVEVKTPRGKMRYKIIEIK